MWADFRSLPNGYRVSTLIEDDANLISQTWSQSTADAESFIRWLINNFHSVAVHTSDGSLAAYMIQQEDGSLGHLRVQPEHRRKGIGQFVVNELAKKATKPGEVSFVHTSSRESYNLHIKCGYKHVMDTVWTIPQL